MITEEYDNLMWRSLCGALGAQKVAYLRAAPLSLLVTAKTAHAGPCALHPSTEMSLADAAAAIGSLSRKKTAEYSSITDGLTALEALGISAPPRESVFRKVATVKKITLLREHASAEESEKLAGAEASARADAFSAFVKLASGNLLSNISKNPAARNLGKSTLTGAGLAAGAAPIAYGVGSHMSENATTDARDKAIQAAAVSSAIAGGTYVGARALDRSLGGTKTSSVSANPQIETDLGAALRIESRLGALEQTEKVAALRAVNADYAAELLCQLVYGE